jgi:outer membrane protein assembly factor BamB
MQRLAVILSLLVGFLWLPAPSIRAQGMISPDQANRAGMVVQWFTQLEGVGPSELVNLDLVIDEDQAITFFEVVGGRLREILSERDLDPAGKPFTVEEAENIAKIRAEVMQARLTANGSTDQVKINRIVLPKSTIYSISNSGILHSINAESGKTNWEIQIGTRSFPTSGVGGSKKYVAAVNGSSVYCLAVETGSILWSRRCSNAVMGPPSVSDTAIYVPLIDGRLQVFQIDGKGHNNQTLISSGRAMYAPTISGRFVSWATDKGMLSVAPIDVMNRINYRLRGESAFLAPATYKGGILFCATANGYVYAIDQAKGSMVWTVSLGEQVRQSPVPLGDYVFVVTDEHKLYKFDARTGGMAEGWSKPRSDVANFVGAGKDRMYVQNKTGSLVILDQKSGGQWASLSTHERLQPLVNFTTDRIYLCSPAGIIECLRETGAVAPFFHDDEFTALATTEPATDSGDALPTGANPADTKPDADADPFGDSKKPAETGDPFGEKKTTPTKPQGDDPFGGKQGADKPKDGDDPFGGG